ncbi:ParA family protein [uncultured Rubinisphaera sp.]|uniref:ParA family protein n=1 Tax=uncultured Rubinisphaera sp. TaxID=1678686 RepID=UPI0030D83370|tara:strand:- start:318 stop:1232 length:915 start_codon:yes stop_codon:yes gene_type:complete
MHIVAIYNNKGGEGKSTVTVGIAEFLAANRNKKVLVIDLDAQASSSCALLGRVALNTAISERRTVVELAAQLRQSRKPSIDPEQFIVWRAGKDARGSALESLALLVPEGDRMYDVETSMQWGRHNDLFLKHLKPKLTEFDYVLLDLPANVTKSAMICINGLSMADFVLIPTRSTHISLNGLPRTFSLIDQIRDVNGNGRPSVIGFLLNATDKRNQQYRSIVKPVVEVAMDGDIPPFFKNHWPSSPAFEASTDEDRDARTLKERFGTAYEHARKVARELEVACEKYEHKQAQPVKLNIWQKLGLA